MVVLSEAGLDWLLDASAEGEWCPACGGPCTKTYWLRTLLTAVVVSVVAMPFAVTGGLAGGVAWLCLVEGESVTELAAVVRDLLG